MTETSTTLISPSRIQNDVFRNINIPLLRSSFDSFSKTLNCELCNNLVTNPIKTECFHTFCSTCLENKLKEKPCCCPTCSKPILLNQTTVPNIIFQQLCELVKNVKSELSQLSSLEEEASPQGREAMLDFLSTERLQEEFTKVDRQKRRCIEKEKKVICLSSSIPTRWRSKLLECIRSNPTSLKEYSSSEDEEVTHFIVRGADCDPTFKYYRAISLGIWVLSEDWLEDPLHNEEKDFQVKSSVCLNVHPSKGVKMNLFKGMKLHLGAFADENVFTKDQAKELITLNGGEVVDVGGNSDGSGMSLPNDSETVVVLVGHPLKFDHLNGECNFCCKRPPGKVTLVESSWITNCLSRNQVLEYGDRVLVL